jgi:translation machinery-associated protein 16
MQQVQSATALSLPELRALISETFLGRNDARVAELNAERRPGRPKLKEHLDLEELRRVEEAEWDSGFGEYNKEEECGMMGGSCLWWSAR